MTVNGQVVRTLGTKVDPDRDSVEVDGEAVVALDKFYVLFNKPKAYITAVTDDRGRPTVMDYLPNLPVPVKPVGRLDFFTEGVLLLTNDGELAAKLLAPASHVPKTYHVKVHGQLKPSDIKRLRDGVQLEDGSMTMPAEVEVLPGESNHSWLAITIHEGKHRQIHRMIEALKSLRRQAAAGRIREPDVPRPARRRCARARSAGAEPAARGADPDLVCRWLPVGAPVSREGNSSLRTTSPAPVSS